MKIALTWLALVALAIIVYPIAVIWSLNTLFKLNIDLALETWIATCVLLNITKFSVTLKK